MFSALFELETTKNFINFSDGPQMLHMQYILCSKPTIFTARGLQHVPRYTKQWKSIQTVVLQRKHNNDYIKYAIIAARAAIIIIIALICHWALYWIKFAITRVVWMRPELACRDRVGDVVREIGKSLQQLLHQLL